MTKTEAAIVCVAVVAATVASALNSLTPALAAILSVAVGYGAGRTVSNLPAVESKK